MLGRFFGGEVDTFESSTPPKVNPKLSSLELEELPFFETYWCPRRGFWGLGFSGFGFRGLWVTGFKVWGRVQPRRRQADEVDSTQRELTDVTNKQGLCSFSCRLLGNSALGVEGLGFRV